MPLPILIGERLVSSRHHGGSLKLARAYGRQNFDQVTDTGRCLRRCLDYLASSCDLAVEARGVGLIQGLELTIPGRPLAEEALEQGLMLNFVQGNIMRILPAFTLERAHVDHAMEIIEQLLTKRLRQPTKPWSQPA